MTGERHRSAGDGVSGDLARVRRRIDALDRKIVRLLNERAQLTIAAGHEKARHRRRWIRDPEREREVLLRVTMANEGPMPQADLIAVYRRLIAAARALEARELVRSRSAATAQPEAGGAAAHGDDPSA